MHTSKLFTLIGGLDPAEFRWLHKFVKSPFYNTNEKVLQLFLYIKKYYPDLAAPKLTKEVAFQYLFPKQKFSAQKMRKLMHELATLVEDFMVAQHFQKNQFERKKVLTKELGQRNIYGLFEKHTNEITAELDSLPYRDKEYYLGKYLNEYQFLSHPVTPRQQNVKDRLLPLSNDLDAFYFLQKLQLNCDLESAKNIYEGETGLPFFEKIEKEIERRNFEETPTIYLYLLVNQLFEKKESEDLFNRLHEQFLSNLGNLSIEDKEQILKYQINFVLQKINKGQSKFVKIGFELYNIGLKENLFTQKNRITENTFTNIVWFGCALKEFEFVRGFIESYEQFIDKERRLEIVLLSKSNLFFNVGNFSEAIDLLVTKSFSNILDKLRAKILLIKSYFELFLGDRSYHNLVLAQIENFERNIRREEKIAPNKKIAYLNFSKSLKKLIHIKLKKQDSISFRNNLIMVDAVSHKSWLIEKTYCII